MIASKLRQGDEIRVVAPSRSLIGVWNDTHLRAVRYVRNKGFGLSYSAHSCELDKYHSSSIERDLNWSEAEMRETSSKHRLNSYENEELPFENYIKIDNTNLAPDVVARIIQERFRL